MSCGKRPEKLENSNDEKESTKTEFAVVRNDWDSSMLSSRYIVLEVNVLFVYVL